MPRFDRKWRLGSSAAFSALMAVAIVSACSSGGQQSFRAIPQAGGEGAEPPISMVLGEMTIIIHFR
jgi:hypothetical protein